MKLEFNLTGSQRKALVLAVSEITNQPLNYKGAPTFAYEVGEYKIDKHGMVTGPDNLDLEDALRQKGFDAETREYDEPTAGPEAEAATEPEAETASAPTADGDTLTIEMPLEGFSDEAFANLEKLVASKAGLIKKAIGAGGLPIEKTGETVQFPWFHAGASPDEVDAYSKLIVALCKMAKEQKRIIAKEKEVDNEKFAFRVFLIRLGFVGAEYKTERKILLRNLTGNSAFKDGPPEKTETAVSAETGINSLEDALANAELVHEVNASFEAEGGDDNE